MAGAGYKLFATGDVLTASDVNTLLNEQTIMVFASTSARDTALASVKSSGMFAFNTDADELYYYDGSSWVQTSLAADITGITTAANSSMAGGATSGAPSLTVDVNNSTSATATAADYVLISDTDDSNATKKALVSDIVSLGDITGVTAGTAISGGGTSGTVTVNVVVDTATLVLSGQVFSG